GLYALAFSPDQRLLASTGDDYTVRLWDVATGKVIRDLSRPGAIARSLAFSPDGKTLVSGHYASTARDQHKQTLHLWDVGSGKDLIKFPSRMGNIIAVAFARDGRTMASAGENSTVRLWDATT